MGFPLRFLSSFSLCLLALLLHRATVTSGCFSMEREALLDFKAGIHDTHNRLSSWVGQDCCAWEGVICGATTGHVVMLDLRNTNITDDWALRGEGMMNSSLLALSHLKHLDLSFNDFSGFRIPEFIGSFKKLRYLNLSSTNFIGGIPARLGNLSSLYVLDLRAALDFTSLDNLDWLSHLTSLKHLDLSWLNLTDLPDWFSSVNMLHSLQVLNNMLDGGLSSSICQWTFLEYLDLSNNKLLGEIPYCPEESLQNLRFLNLGNNHFSGEIPHTIGFLSELQLLQLKNNSFSGEVPLSLKTCTNLWFLDLTQNNLVGSITLWIGENLQQMQVLRLRSNMFSGVIPWQLARFEHLHILDLANNNFSGSIPHNIGNLSAMRSTSQYYDFCTVELDVFTKGQDLHYLKCSMQLMKSLDLSNNSLTGEIPKGIGDLAGLKNLNLSRNYLQGKIPWEIGGMKSLESLDLSINDLSGSIPESLSALYFLSYLNLSYNNLSGMIPFGHQL
ncbi:LRR receptor-like serine/threonine-protein kinase SIK1 isoform X1 [Musa acuminata AAA Group]|uniref:LRR receptor-like serine/threonine-protein kinase SIK1 isoform X1 n=1 Tax=Musa acuminata AAA Group TaxID=214697 RepID=UPI0031DF9890